MVVAGRLSFAPTAAERSIDGADALFGWRTSSYRSKWPSRHSKKKLEHPMRSHPSLKRADVIDQALQRVLGEIQAGLHHGYFEFTVSCEIVGHERRQFVLRAGKSYRFLIPKDECLAPQSSMAIPATGTPARELDEPRSIVGMTSARQAQTAIGLVPLVAHGEPN
jgi:hypothetical protein